MSGRVWLAASIALAVGGAVPGYAKPASTSGGSALLRPHPGPAAEASAVRRLQDALAQGGLRGASDLVEGCYRAAGTAPQATADCLLLDVTAMLFDGATRKLTAQGGRDDPGPATPFLAVDAYKARLDAIGPAVFGSKPRALGTYLGRAPDRVVASLAVRPPPPAPPAAPPPGPAEAAAPAPAAQADAAPAPPPASAQAMPVPAPAQTASPPAAPASAPTRTASVRLAPVRPEIPGDGPDPIQGASLPSTPAQPAPVELVGPIRAHPGAAMETEIIQRFRIAIAEGGIQQAAQAIEACYAKAAPKRQATADCLLWDAAAILVEITPRAMLIQQGRVDPGAASEFFTPDAFQLRRNSYRIRVFGPDPAALATYLGQAPERVMEAVLRQPTPPTGPLVLQVPAPPEDAPAVASTPARAAPVRLQPRPPLRSQPARTASSRPSPDRAVPSMLGPVY